MHSFSRFALSLSLTALVATASEPATPPAREPAVELDPLVVTGAKAAQPLVVTTDPKAPAQPMPAHDGADALRAVPGFAVIRKGGTDGDPVLRGMAGSRLGVQLDGQCIFGGCGNRMDPPTAYVFPAAYDRITVVKGPQSVLYGPGNSAGVVLFERTYRRLAARESSLFGSVTAGSFGRFDAVADARTGAPDWQIRATGTTTRADDYADGAGRDVHSAYRRWSANATAAWTPDALTFIELSGAVSDGEAAYADRAMDGVKFARDNYALRLRREQLTPLVAAVELRGFHNYVDHVMDNYSLRTFAASMMMPNPAVSNPDRETTGATAQLELTPGESTRLTLGADTQTNVHTLRSTTNETASPYEAKARVRDARFEQRGLFGEAAVTLAPGSRAYVGARLDQWKATDNRAVVALSMMSTAPNPSAGRTRTSDLASGFVRYERDLGAPGRSTATLFAGLGRTQRYPDYWEAIKNESTASVTAFSTRPETTTQLDVGTLGKIGALEWNASLFAARIDDFILVQSGFTKPSGMMGTRSAVVTRNIDATTRGGEAGLAWRFATDWKLDASLAYVRGTNDTDARPLAQLPPLESRLALAYTRPTWSAGALVRAVARQNRVAIGQGNIVGQDLGETAGFGTLALHASWKPTARTRLSAGVDNVFDRTYAEHLSKSGAMVPGFVQTARVNEPGRTLWLKLDVTL